ncbi:hypothetical protein [Actinokineospora globicatena]|uniref:hypothetical protein n=1 Tax=Actinokineospora globicatena TaxID=103729 RepID=UPI0020A5C600|nr:hypothetical protein [Actinokineospora globicatena]MCP2303831.1 hypothetical protein [Actinokineospora globicatena]GLW79015.1 hypothetical protein Aglo01_34970 [Actinokineospora globicatena]GLW86574.1 hypothetical protein Aglo02_42130 [Actinokineospora globicatena]
MKIKAVLISAMVAGAAFLGVSGTAVAAPTTAGTSVTTASTDGFGPSCTKGKNLTNGWGQCTTKGSYKWRVRVWCTLGGSGESSVVQGATRTNAYCSWGNVEQVELVFL